MVKIKNLHLLNNLFCSIKEEDLSYQKEDYVSYEKIFHNL